MRSKSAATLLVILGASLGFLLVVEAANCSPPTQLKLADSWVGMSWSMRAAACNENWWKFYKVLAENWVDEFGTIYSGELLVRNMVSQQVIHICKRS